MGKSGNQWGKTWEMVPSQFDRKDQRVPLLGDLHDIGL